ncbi:MAG TPA: hypothetical protein V6C50_01700 [Crinalium sp.]
MADPFEVCRKFFSQKSTTANDRTANCLERFIFHREAGFIWIKPGFSLIDLEQTFLEA